MTGAQILYNFVLNFLPQIAADTAKKAAFTVGLQYQLYVTSLNALHETGVFPEAFSASDAFQWSAEYFDVLGYPDIQAMINTAEGEGYWDVWPINTAIPVV